MTMTSVAVMIAIAASRPGPAAELIQADLPLVSDVLDAARRGAANMKAVEPVRDPRHYRGETDQDRCRRDDKCLMVLLVEVEDGRVVAAQLKAKKILREGHGVVYMDKPYIEVPGYYFGIKRYSLGTGDIDHLICAKLGGAPYPMRVLGSSFFGRDVAVASGTRVVVDRSASTFIEWLKCQHDPDTAY